MVNPSLVRGSKSIPAVRSHDGGKDNGCVRFLRGGEGRKAAARQRLVHVVTFAERTLLACANRMGRQPATFAGRSASRTLPAVATRPTHVSDQTFDSWRCDENWCGQWWLGTDILER